LNGRMLERRAKFKPVIFPVLGLSLSSIANICVFMVLYDFSLL
jgi:hypothetical protein